jgi:TolA-binding protein
MVCTNGLVVNHLGETIFRKHTKNVQEDIEIPKAINTAFAKVDELKEKLDTMNEKIVSMALLEKTVSALGVRNAQEAGLGDFSQKRNGESEFKIDDSLLKVSQYTLLNMLTYQISHNIDMKMRYAYQQKIAKTFQL